MIVTVHKPHVITLDKVVLMPGANNVDAEKFKEELKNPMVQTLIDIGVLSIEGDSGVVAATHLKDMSAKAAIDLIEMTIDKSLLGVWASSEERKGVLSAIKKQLESLESVVESDDMDLDTEDSE